jgi:hypothetical protein
MVMKFTFCNTTETEIKIYIEPSADEFLLAPLDAITITSLTTTTEDFLVTTKADGMVVFLPKQTSAAVHINGVKVFSFCEEFPW